MKSQRKIKNLQKPHQNTILFNQNSFHYSAEDPNQIRKQEKPTSANLGKKIKKSNKSIQIKKERKTIHRI